MPDPQVGKSVVGPRTFLTVEEFLWYNCSAICGLSDQQLYGGVNGVLKEGLCLRLYDQITVPEPLPRGRPLPSRTSAEDSNTGLAQSLWGLCVLGHTRLSLRPLSISGGFSSVQLLNRVRLFVIS